MLVSFLDLGGATVYVESTLVASLTPVPANVLPAGVAAGTYCNESGGPERLAVQGTPDFVATAIASADGAALPAAQVGSDGSVLGQRGGVAVTPGGTGVYGITWNIELAAAEAAFFVTPDNSAARIAAFVQTGPSAGTVRLFDAAGAAAASGFFFSAVRLNAAE